MKSLKIIFIVTFLMGFLTGVFVYLTNDLLPGISLGEDDVGTVDDAEFVIIGEVYGGCQRMGSCPSYRLDASGEYSYLLPERGGEGEVFTDRLTHQRLNALRTHLNRTDLEAVAESEFTGECPAAYDSAAYEFEITLDGEMYSIDTCEHDAAHMELFELLIDYFGIFRLTHQGS